MQEAVHLRRELGQRRPALGGDDSQRRLHHGHDERRGDAFAGDVRERDADALVAEVEEVVVVAADAAGRQAEGGQHGAGAAPAAVSGSRRLWTSAASATSRRSFSCSTTRVVSARVLDHQRQLFGALRAAAAFRRSCTARRPPGGPSSSTPRISPLARSGTAIRAPPLEERLNLRRVRRVVLARPAQPAIEIGSRERQRVAVEPERGPRETPSGRQRAPRALFAPGSRRASGTRWNPARATLPMWHRADRAASRERARTPRQTTTRLAPPRRTRSAGRHPARRGSSSRSETARDRPASVCRSVWRVDCHIVPGSLRIATIGDSRVARHAGKNDATVVTARRSAVEAMNGSAPRSPISKTRTSAHDDEDDRDPANRRSVGGHLQPARRRPSATDRGRWRRAPSACRSPPSPGAPSTTRRRRCQATPSAARRGRRTAS